MMLKTGILNPHILALLARVRHTNLLIIADRGFPYWPSLETVDISLVDNIPTVLQVFQAIRPNFDMEKIYMASEFLAENDFETRQKFNEAFSSLHVTYEEHQQIKQRVPGAIGIIRTGDITQYANIVIVSGRSEP